MPRTSSPGTPTTANLSLIATEVPNSADDGGNGKASIGDHADSDADAITIELKSS